MVVGTFNQEKALLSLREALLDTNLFAPLHLDVLLVLEVVGVGPHGEVGRARHQAAADTHGGAGHGGPVAGVHCGC